MPRQQITAATAALRWTEGISLLFCKHKYAVLGGSKIYSVYPDGKRSENPTGFLIVQRCEKCGKIKQTKARI